MAVNF